MGWLIYFLVILDERGVLLGCCQCVTYHYDMGINFNTRDMWGLLFRLLSVY